MRMLYVRKIANTGYCNNVDFKVYRIFGICKRKAFFLSDGLSIACPQCS